MALMISRMEVESPPGVSISRMTKGLPRRCAVSSPCSTYSAVAGPIAPRISRPRAAGRTCADIGGAALVAVDAKAIAGAAATTAATSAATWARIDASLIGSARRFRASSMGRVFPEDADFTRLAASTLGRTRQAGMLRAEGLMSARSGGGCATGSRRLVCRNELLPAAADEIGTPHAPQRLAQRRPVVGIMIAQKRLVQAPHLEALRHPDLAPRAVEPPEGILSRMIHRGGRCHRGRQEGLHLVRAKAIALQPQCQLQHVLIARARVGRNEVGNQVLLLAGLARVALEERLEAVVGADSRLHHHRQRTLRDRFRRDLEISARVMLGELPDVFGGLDGEVVAHARGDEHLANAGKLADLAVEADERCMIGVEIGADARVDARGPAAGALDLAAAAGQPVHVGRRSAQIGDDTGEARDLIADRLDLAQHGAFRAALDDPPLVLRDGAEGAA